MCNASYLISRSGILKILSMILGVVSLYGGIKGYFDSDHNAYCEDGSYFNVDDNNSTIFHRLEMSGTFKVYCDMLWMEKSFLVGVSGITLISIIILCIFIVSQTAANSKISDVIDFAFHFAGGILLLIFGIFMGFSVIKIQNEICSPMDSIDSDCQLFFEKIGAAGFALLDGIVFFVIVLSVNKIRVIEKFEDV